MGYSIGGIHLLTDQSYSTYLPPRIFIPSAVFCGSISCVALLCLREFPEPSLRSIAAFQPIPFEIDTSNSAVVRRRPNSVQ